MSEAQVEYTVAAQIYDTPQAWIYAEYDRRKNDIFQKCETREEYHARLAELINELVF